MIVGIILTDNSGSFDIDRKETTLNWIVFSDNINDFAERIITQGTVPPNLPMILNGQAMGWHPPGCPYQLGNDFLPFSYAGTADVSEREIIRGQGGKEIVISGNQIALVPHTPSNVIVKWKVTQKYSTEAQKKEADDRQPSVEDKVTIKCSTEYEEIPFERDVLNGDPVVNSALQVFNPPTTIKRKIPVFTITRREIFNPLAKCISYSNVVNADTYYGAPPGTLLMESVTASFDGTAWSDVTYTIKQKPEGWQTYLLDAGYEELEKKEKEIDGMMKTVYSLSKILSDDGTPISEPAKLDGKGKALDKDSKETYMIGPYHKYEERIFALLQLPNPFIVNTVLQ